MIKCKTFFGSCGKSEDRADTLFNEWSKNNPNIKIIQYFYEQARYGDHSICIFYEE